MLNIKDLNKSLFNFLSMNDFYMQTIFHNRINNNFCGAGRIKSYRYLLITINATKRSLVKYLKSVKYKPANPSAIQQNKRKSGGARSGG